MRYAHAHPIHQISKRQLGFLRHAATTEAAVISRKTHGNGVAIVKVYNNALRPKMHYRFQDFAYSISNFK